MAFSRLLDDAAMQGDVGRIERAAGVLMFLCETLLPYSQCKALEAANRPQVRDVEVL